MSLELIVGVVALGVGVALSPVAVIAAILLLVSPGGRGKGGAFLAGWIGGLALVGIVVVTLERAVGVGGGGGVPGWVGPAVSLLLGLVLLAYGALRLAKRPAPGDDDPTPAWMSALQASGAGKALATGALLAAIKPKNLALTLAAATSIAEAALAPTVAVVALVIYLAVASIGVAAPLVVAVALGDRATAVLDGWKTWLTAHNAAVMAVVLVIFGVLLVWKGVTGLA